MKIGYGFRSYWGGGGAGRQAQRYRHNPSFPEKEKSSHTFENVFQ
jgi:hypothetical protein